MQQSIEAQSAVFYIRNASTNSFLEIFRFTKSRKAQVGFHPRVPFIATSIAWQGAELFPVTVSGW